MEATEAEQWAALMQKDYHHPFTPYHVQREFMSRVYKCLEDGKVGIFESPTGTVRTYILSTTLERCGTLALRESRLNVALGEIGQVVELDLW